MCSTKLVYSHKVQVEKTPQNKSAFILRDLEFLNGYQKILQIRNEIQDVPLIKYTLFVCPAT